MTIQVPNMVRNELILDILESFLPPKRTRKRRRKSLACDGFKIVHGALAGFAKSSTKFHKSVFAFRFGRKSVHFKDLQHSLFLEMWNR